MVEDLLLEWRPDKLEGIKVDFLNVYCSVAHELWGHALGTRWAVIASPMRPYAEAPDGPWNAWLEYPQSSCVTEQ